MSPSSLLVPKTEQDRETFAELSVRRLNEGTWGREGSALNIRELVSELKRQRRHLDRAIVALEALEKRKRPERRYPASRKPKAMPVPARKTGTSGQLIPFLTSSD
jgi:hypothetical protein